MSTTVDALLNELEQHLVCLVIADGKIAVTVAPERGRHETTIARYLAPGEYACEHLAEVLAEARAWIASRTRQEAPGAAK